MNDRNITPQMMNLLNKNQIHQMMIKNQQQPQRPQPPMSNLQNVPLPMHNYMNQNQPMNVNVPIMNQNSHMLNQQNINQMNQNPISQNFNLQMRRSIEVNPHLMQNQQTIGKINVNTNNIQNNLNNGSQLASPCNVSQTSNSQNVLGLK